MTARNLTDANPALGRDVSGEKNPMYGKGLRGERNGMFGRTLAKCPNWKGGRRVRADGYVIVVVPESHPHGCRKSKRGPKYALEHRVVMEKHLGRYLEPGEVVHHKDENPSNNDIGNLELLPSQSVHASLHGKHRKVTKTPHVDPSSILRST